MASGRLVRMGAAVLSLAALGACAKHPGDAAPAPWSFTQTADGPELSATAVESSFKGADKDYSPMLHIVCRHDRPNVELDPIFITYSCGADCAQGGKVGFDEGFVTTADPNPRLAEVREKGQSSPPQAQDLLSNAPGDIVITGDTKSGVSQGGEWDMQSGSTTASRFDYGTAQADAAYVTSVDNQAHNFIGRLAASQWFKVSQGASVARFDTRALGTSLAKLWSVCPAPSAK